MNLTKRLKIQLAKILQQFSETPAKDVEGNDIIIVSDMPLTIGSEVFTLDADGETIVVANGDYTTEDETVYTVLDGFITASVPKVENTPEVEVEMEDTPEVAPEVIPQITIDEIISAITPVINEAVKDLKQEILAEVDAKLSKISFSKPADLEVSDKETKFSTTNKAAQILGSK